MDLNSNETRVKIILSAATILAEEALWTMNIPQPKRKKKHIDKVLKKMGR